MIKNKRRPELIKKFLERGLTWAEAHELEMLQKDRWREKQNNKWLIKTIIVCILMVVGAVGASYCLTKFLANKKEIVLFAFFVFFVAMYIASIYISKAINLKHFNKMTKQSQSFYREKIDGYRKKSKKN